MIENTDDNNTEKRFNDWENGRVTQLIYYMQDCQQGIRDTNGHIFSVLAASVSMLTVFFGLSIFGEEIDKRVMRRNGRLLAFKHYGVNIIDRTTDILEDIITVRRLAFWFTSMIFIIAFLVVMILGIDVILRYHYCQHLGDRLHDLIKGARDDKVRNALVIYEQFSSPIKTCNINHLTNSHNFLNFTAHYIAGGLAFVFASGAIFTQFALLEKRYWYDWSILIIIGLVLSIAALLFIRFNYNSDKIVDMAFAVAHQNLDVRKGNVQDELYKNAKHFLKALLYLLLPRRDIIHKDAFIIAGFTVVSLMDGDFFPIRLIFVYLIYSVLLCQARYQFNDLCGLEGDDNDKRTDRLYAGGPVRKSYLINVSIFILVARIVLAIILIIFLGRGLKKEIFYCSMALVFVTLCYEIFRKFKLPILTTVFVGFGYTLRFYVGAIAAEQNIVGNIPLYIRILFGIVFWLWGMLGCLLSWMKEVEEQIKNKTEEDIKRSKQHIVKIYEYLKTFIHYEEKTEESGSNQVNSTSFLLNQYKMKSIYNVLFWAILFFIGILFLQIKPAVYLPPIYDPLFVQILNKLFILKTIVPQFVGIMLILLCGSTSICKSSGTMVVLIVCSVVWALLSCLVVYTKTTNVLEFSLLTVLTIAVTTSVLIMRVIPKTKSRKSLRKTFYSVKRVLFGKYVADMSTGMKGEF